MYSIFWNEVNQQPTQDNYAGGNLTSSAAYLRVVGLSNQNPDRIYSVWDEDIGRLRFVKKSGADQFTRVG